MGAYDTYRDGDYNGICDRCGKKVKASMLLLEWDGLRCCRRCLDPRHPQDLLRPPTPERPPTWTRPVPPAIFLPSASNGIQLVGQMLSNQTYIG